MKAIRPATCVALAACAAILAAGECAAQGTSLFGSRGPTGGNSTFGSTAAGSTGSGFTTSGAGAGSTGGFGQSAGGFGTSGTAGGTGFGATGTGSTLGTGQNTFGQASGFGQARQAGAFVGMGNTAQNFVGSQQASQQAFQQFSQQFNRAGGSNFQNAGQGGTQQQRVIRPRLRANIEYSQPRLPEITNRVQTRFRSLGTRRPEMSGLTFTLDESGTARLRGTVASDDARKVAELLARLEPGVRTVESELEISSPVEDQ